MPLELVELEARLPFACQGKTWAMGGLNITHLRTLCNRKRLNNNGNREMLIMRLCSTQTPVPINESSDCMTCQAHGFAQTVDLCWFHASSVALLFPDQSRKTVWNSLFKFDANGDIPIELRKVKPEYNLATVLTFEIMRRGLELSIIQNFGVDNITKPQLVRRDSIMLCSIGTYDIICSLSNWCCDKTSQEGRTSRSGGNTARFLNEIAPALGVNVDYIKYTSDRKFNNKVQSFIMIYLREIGDRHAVTIFLCKGYWHYFDNNDMKTDMLNTYIDRKLYYKATPENKNGTCYPLSILKGLGMTEPTRSIYYGLSFPKRTIQRTYVSPKWVVPTDLTKCNRLVRLNRFLRVLTKNQVNELWLIVQSHPNAFKNIFNLNNDVVDQVIINELFGIYL